MKMNIVEQKHTNLFLIKASNIQMKLVTWCGQTHPWKLHK